jgi:hypothetical protein
MLFNVDCLGACTMDLLGSILGSMEKPPENQERKKIRG